MTPSTDLGSGAMFDRIAHRYDLLNRLMSFGLDRGWRRRALQALTAAVPIGGRVLDVATGTGDVALTLAKQRPDLVLAGVDPSREMLARARQKPGAAGIHFDLGVAEELAFPDAHFDGVIIAFGIRNVGDRPRALREFFRVLKPGGRLVILELGEPRSRLAAPSRFYIHGVVPRLGAWLSGAREYRYLERSIRAFPPAPVFAELMTEAGFAGVEVAPLAFGACHIYAGTRSSSVA